jgi:hypothetical protein
MDIRATANCPETTKCPEVIRSGYQECQCEWRLWLPRNVGTETMLNSKSERDDVQL